ncbi:MAG TPA: metal ABC transporter permease [Bauldia sp.]|nr:metal ABC transporter permease [Bauldia sp.]
MLSYDFVLRAFAASGLVALVAGSVGWFLVLRGQTFAGHALSHVGFAGATGAVLIGVPPLAGMVAFTLLAGLGMGLLAERLSGRDVAIGIVLAVALAFGLLFLNLNKSTSLQATSILFGNVLAVSPTMLITLGILCVIALGILALLSRSLLFATLQPELAEARGVSPRLIGTLFLGVVALAVAQSVQIVGVLLVFALMVGPPAAAQLLTTRVLPGIALSAVLAIGEAWLGITISWHSDLPTSFSIVLVSALVYFAAVAGTRGSRSA